MFFSYQRVHVVCIHHSSVRWEHLDYNSIKIKDLYNEKEKTGSYIFIGVVMIL